MLHSREEFHPVGQTGDARWGRKRKGKGSILFEWRGGKVFEKIGKPLRVSRTVVVTREKRVHLSTRGGGYP